MSREDIWDDYAVKRQIEEQERRQSPRGEENGSASPAASGNGAVDAA
jgi:hypothetical protein